MLRLRPYVSVGYFVISVRSGICSAWDRVQIGQPFLSFFLSLNLSVNLFFVVCVSSSAVCVVVMLFIMICESRHDVR